MEFYILGEFPDEPIEKLVVIDNDDFGEKSYRKYSPDDENNLDLEIVKASKFFDILDMSNKISPTKQYILKVNDYPAFIYGSVNKILTDSISNSTIRFENEKMFSSSSPICIVYQQGSYFLIFSHLFIYF
jgi:hypothetical protein